MKNILVKIMTGKSAAAFLAAVLMLTSFYLCLPALAVWDGQPYSSGATYDPECAPGVTNCTIKTPALAGANTDLTSVTGLINSTVSGNSYFAGGKVGIGTTTPAAALTVYNGSILFWGNIGANPIGSAYNNYNVYAPQGIVWMPAKGSFFTGSSFNVEWTDSYSGPYAFIAGGANYAQTEGGSSIGYLNGIGGLYSLAAVSRSQTYGNSSISIGRRCYTNGTASIAFGSYVYGGNSGGDRSIAIGEGLSSPETWIRNNYADTLMMGFNSDIPTLTVTPGSGAGTVGNVGVGTSTPSSLLTVAGFTGTSTVTVGETALSAGCLKFLDTDRAGYTYCEFSSGAMTCSQDSCEN